MNDPREKQPQNSFGMSIQGRNFNSLDSKNVSVMLTTPGFVDKETGLSLIVSKGHEYMSSDLNESNSEGQNKGLVSNREPHTNPPTYSSFKHN